MPRRRRPPREDDLPLLRHVEPRTQALHTQVLTSFEAWLQSHVSDLFLHMIVHAPCVCDALIAQYGRVQFSAGRPLYYYLLLITAVIREHSHLKHSLSLAWNVASNWRIKEPVVHRLPTPRALAKALFALSYLLGFERFAGCSMLAFFGPGRIGEILRCSRKHLVLPSDMLFEPSDLVLLEIPAPKSRFRGGATVQHISIRDVVAVKALQTIFGDLSPADKLYPFSPATFRSRWDLCMKRLGVPLKMFTPGGLRGGGAVSAYLSGAHIADILWRMRLKHLTTLEHYLQEVSAAISLHSLSKSSRARVSLLCLCFDRLF